VFAKPGTSAWSGATFAWQLMQSGAGVAVHVIGWPATYGGTELVWQRRHAMPACGPESISKHAAWAAKRPGKNRHAP
jgi:hypothetical protein